MFGSGIEIFLKKLENQINLMPGPDRQSMRLG